MKFRVFISHFHRTPIRRSLLGMNTRCVDLFLQHNVSVMKSIVCYRNTLQPDTHTKSEYSPQSLYWFLTLLLHTITKFKFLLLFKCPMLPAMLPAQTLLLSIEPSTAIKHFFFSTLSFFVHCWPNNVDNNPFKGKKFTSIKITFVSCKATKSLAPCGHLSQENESV